MAGNKLYDLNPIPVKSNNPLNLYSGLFETPSLKSVSSVPTWQDSFPDAASNNPTIKPATNGVTAGQIIGLASDAMGIYGGYLGTRGQVRALKAQAREYETQMDLNYDAYRRNVGYLAEENLANVSRIQNEYQEMLGSQSAAMGASGFDVSAGEQRIFRDTEIKADEAKYLANRSTYLQSYELWRSTELENARLKAAAKMARSQAKYTKKMGKLNLVSGLLGAAANFISLGSYGKTGDVGVKGV
jgi:hypothetical protein